METVFDTIFLLCCSMFKSYYVVWKLVFFIAPVIAPIGLNRTM